MPDINPIIAGLQSQVDALINGTKTSGAISDEQVTQLLKDRPDVLAEYNRLLPTIDWNSPWAGQHGFTQGGGPNDFARWWYTQGGGNKEYTFGDQANANPSPTQVADDIKTKADDATNTAITGLTKTTTDLLAQLQAQNTSLTGLISTQADNFAKSQADLLKNFDQAKADSATQMGALMKQLQDQVTGQANSTGQAAKKPNYAQALRRNKDLNSNGLSSTMLTGAQGVAPTALTLGFTNLLGA